MNTGSIGIKINRELGIRQNILDEGFELVERCKANDRNAQIELYNKYVRAMFNTAWRIVKDKYYAEDVVQEAFINAFKNIESFDPSRKVTFGSWLKRIVINKSLDFVRMNKNWVLTDDDNIVPLYPNDEDIDEKDLSKIALGVVKEEMEKLPEKYSIPLTLFYLEGYDQKEIAEILKMNNSTVRTVIMRGKNLLKNKILLK